MYKNVKILKPEQQAVTCNPDTKEIERRESDKFIVLACDGIWDCLTNEQCVALINKKITNFKKRNEIIALNNPDNVDFLPRVTELNYSIPIAEIFDDILAKDTGNEVGTDNMTCIMIKLKN